MADPEDRARGNGGMGTVAPAGVHGAEPPLGVIQPGNFEISAALL